MLLFILQIVQKFGEAAGDALSLYDVISPLSHFKITHDHFLKTMVMTIGSKCNYAAVPICEVVLI